MNHASKLPGFSCQFVFQVVSLGTLQERDGESGQSREGPTISGVSWRKSWLLRVYEAVCVSSFQMLGVRIQSKATWAEKGVTDSSPKVIIGSCASVVGISSLTDLGMKAPSSTKQQVKHSAIRCNTVQHHTKSLHLTAVNYCCLCEEAVHPDEASGKEASIFANCFMASAVRRWSVKSHVMTNSRQTQWQGPSKVPCGFHLYLMTLWTSQLYRLCLRPRLEASYEDVAAALALLQQVPVAAAAAAGELLTENTLDICRMFVTDGSFDDSTTWCRM